MSTRSFIALQNKNGSVDAIYCHHDGYIEYVGNLLKEYYTKEEKVRRLFELGDLSVLGEDPVDSSWNGAGPEEDKECTNTLRFYKQCLSYQARGESCPVSTYLTAEEMTKTAFELWAEYIYLGEVDKNGNITWKVCTDKEFIEY